MTSAVYCSKSPSMHACPSSYSWLTVDHEENPTRKCGGQYRGKAHYSLQKTFGTISRTRPLCSVCNLLPFSPSLFPPGGPPLAIVPLSLLLSLSLSLSLSLLPTLPAAVPLMTECGNSAYSRALERERRTVWMTLMMAEAGKVKASVTPREEGTERGYFP